MILPMVALLCGVSTSYAKWSCEPAYKAQLEKVLELQGKLVEIKKELIEMSKEHRGYIAESNKLQAKANALDELHNKLLKQQSDVEQELLELGRKSTAWELKH